MPTVPYRRTIFHSRSTGFVIVEFFTHSSLTWAHLVRRAGRSSVGGEKAGNKHIASGEMRINDMATQLGHFPELRRIHFKHPPARARRTKVGKGEALSK